MEVHMFLSRRISMLLLLVGFFHGLQADFIDLQVWRRATPSGESQYLICCGDRHSLTSKADEQSNDLIEFLNQRNNPHDVVLIEDLEDYTYIVERARAYFKANVKDRDESCLQDVQLRYYDYIESFFPSQSSALGKVAQKIANKENIKSLNVDFRALFSITDWSSCFPAWEKFLSEELDDFIIKGIVQEVQSYNDCPSLNEHYKKCTSPFLCMLEAGGSLSFKGICHTLEKYSDDKSLYLHPSLDHYYKYFHYYKYLLKLIDREEVHCQEHYVLLMASLMDARILHHIYQKQVQQRHENVVVVCAGYGHIVGIKPTLSVLGYERIYQEGPSLHDECIEYGLLNISQSLKDAFDIRLSVHIWLFEVERRKKMEQRAKMERRMNHILLGFDVDMGDNVQSPLAKFQAKL